MRLDEEKRCLLVIVGVRVNATKALVALAEGYREPAGSWADLLRDRAGAGFVRGRLFVRSEPAAA